ncbi:MAG: prolipoprotein diacylglyceryl transferase [Eubacteriaceae bacterium]
MLPIIYIEVLGMNIHLVSYKLFALSAMIVGLILTFIIMRHEKIAFRKIIILLFCTCISFLIGARLLNFFVNSDAYGFNFHVWTLRLTNFSLYGGIIGATMSTIVIVRILKLDLWKQMDMYVLPMGVAFSIARVGCFMAGCCAGKLTFSPLGVHFPNARLVGESLNTLSSFFSFAEPGLYPTQLYEMALALVGLIPVMILYSKNKLPNGGAFLLYAMWFSAMRWFILYFRDYPYSELITTWVYPFMYFIIIIVAFRFYICKRRIMNEEAKQC